jgi:ABC-2 type transport system ATP-binding protein
MRYAMIRTEDLSKTYRQRLGVSGITLEVEPGEIFGYLGPTGAGKTTTIRLLLDFIRPTSGHALILGWDHHLHSVKIRAHVGYLPGEFTLYGHFSGEKVLRYLSRLRGGVAWQHVMELVERFALNIQRKLNTMSASDKCKLGLVQAFMHRPDLLMLDDPSRELDAAGQAVLYDLLFEARSEGRSIFLASSSLAEMERVADRVAILHQGELLAIERGVQLRSRTLQRVADCIGRPPTLEEAIKNYYGVNGYAV